MSEARGLCQLSPGYLVVIEDHFDADDAYFLTASSISPVWKAFTRRIRMSRRFIATGSKPCPKALPFARRGDCPRRRCRVSQGVSSDRRGPGHCNKYGRIKVHFLGVTGKAAEGNSCWVRVAQ